MSTKGEHAKPVVQTVAWPTDAASARGNFTPGQVYSKVLAARAEARIWHIGYSILRSQAFAALNQLGGAFDILMRGMEHYRAEMYQAISEGSIEGSRGEAMFQGVGRATHWQVILTLGVAVENLVAMEMAYDAYRAGSNDVGDVFLGHSLDLIGELDRKARRRLGYWESVAAMPNESDLIGAGCSRQEASAHRSATRKWASRQRGLQEKVRAFYTPTMHNLYLRHKHGYSLINPAASPVLIDARADPAAVNSALQEGFAVGHRTFDGRIELQILKSDLDEIAKCIEVGKAALSLSQAMGTAWVWQVEHADGRTISLDIELSDDDTISAVEKWVGPEMLGTYPWDRFIAQELAAESDES